MTIKNCSLLVIGVGLGLLMGFVLSFMGIRESSVILMISAAFVGIGLAVRRVL